jgi:hypothetical protein
MIQGYVSESLQGLETGLIYKYELIEYKDNELPVVFMGMYREDEFNLLKQHEGPATVVYFGSDALHLDPEWVEILKDHVNIGVSEQVVNTLYSKGIKAVHFPFNAVIPDRWINKPLGDRIFWYSGNAPEYYGQELIDQIKERVPYTIIRAGSDTFTRDQLVDVYSQCFINLRLTPHDGCPNTNIEMGLMGRRSIYNGDLPCSIRWNTVDDICHSIEREYLRRDKNNKQITAIYKQFVNYERMSTLFV